MNITKQFADAVHTEVTNSLTGADVIIKPRGNYLAYQITTLAGIVVGLVTEPSFLASPGIAAGAIICAGQLRL